HGREDRASLRAQTDLGTRALVVLMVGLFGIVVLLSQVVLRIAYREEFSGAGTILPIMLAAVLCSTVVVAAVNFLTTTTGPVWPCVSSWPWPPSSRSRSTRNGPTRATCAASGSRWVSRRSGWW